MLMSRNVSRDKVFRVANVLETVAFCLTFTPLIERTAMLGMLSENLRQIDGLPAENKQ